jgi:exonuclease VII small subunit
MAPDDFTLTVEEVSKRLNKSVRTVHRYKDAGRLSFRVGTTHGNPIYFSLREVEQLARELYPNMPAAAPPADPDFLAKLDKVERVLSLLEGNPALDLLLKQLANSGAAPEDALAELSRQVQAIERAPAALDRKALGQLLIRLGQALVDQP